MSKFNKLVSNLPFQPTLLADISFYARRLKSEEKIRRLGFYLVTLILIAQFLSIVFPSKPSLATSVNDIIYGASSKEDIIKAYSNNKDNLGRRDIKAIYNHYGIGLEQIISAKAERIGSRQRDFISTGRSTSPGVDTFIHINDVNDGGIYQRRLSNWDISGRQSWYDTLTGMSKYGFRFWLITDGCGNIVFEQNSLHPKLQITKKLITKNIVNTSDKVTYLIQFRNMGPGHAKNVLVSDKLDERFSFLSYQSNTNLKFKRSGSLLQWQINNTNSELNPSERWYTINLNLKISNATTSERICNQAVIDASHSKQVIADDSTDKRCINTPTIVKPDEPQAQISLDKSVSNLTQNLKDANNTTAKPGDRLKYTIYVINNGNVKVNGLELNGEYGESINDILEYADLIDYGDAFYNKQTNFLTWGKVDIPAGSKIEKTFTVQVKDPLPSTPVSASDPLSFDFMMQNKYGRLVTVKLDKSTAKVVELGVTTLPNTGPGSTMLVTAIIFAVVGYFYYRNRLMVKEVSIIHKEFCSGGF